MIHSYAFTNFWICLQNDNQYCHWSGSSYDPQPTDGSWLSPSVFAVLLLSSWSGLLSTLQPAVKCNCFRHLALASVTMNCFLTLTDGWWTTVENNVAKEEEKKNKQARAYWWGNWKKKIKKINRQNPEGEGKLMHWDCCHDLSVDCLLHWFTSLHCWSRSTLEPLSKTLLPANVMSQTWKLFR